MLALVVIVRVAPGPPVVRVMVLSEATGQFGTHKGPVTDGGASEMVPEKPLTPAAVMMLVTGDPGANRVSAGLADNVKSLTEKHCIRLFDGLKKAELPG